MEVKRVCDDAAQKPALARLQILFFMLLSMTGYGRASRTFGHKTINCEVRALNSKLTDLKMKLPPDLREREIEIRKFITDRADRGKIDFLLELQNADGGTAGAAINESLFRAYFSQLSKLKNELGQNETDLFAAILRIPGVVGSASGDIDDDEWEAMLATAEEALAALQKFRKTEGKILAKDLRERVSVILKNLHEIEPFEAARYEKMRARLLQNLSENGGSENVDKNRFEQEVLFYLEKMDINEEKVRLEQHCKYFLEQFEAKKNEPLGRSLSFISQELGREINTLGAKAYDADIQKLVVQMKDELEKIKEQLANVL